jgi:hypothetical protein
MNIRAFRLLQDIHLMNCLVEAPEALGCAKRFGEYRMGLKFYRPSR